MVEGSRVTSRGSRVTSRGSRVNGRGSSQQFRKLHLLMHFFFIIAYYGRIAPYRGVVIKSICIYYSVTRENNKC